MFNVVDKTTGETFTVYGTNGTHFLCYNAERDWWFYKYIEECRPTENGLTVFMDHPLLQRKKGTANDHGDQVL